MYSIDVMYVTHWPMTKKYHFLDLATQIKILAITINLNQDWVLLISIKKMGITLKMKFVKKLKNLKLVFLFFQVILIFEMRISNTHFTNTYYSGVFDQKI